jgi:hypothetical protein
VAVDRVPKTLFKHPVAVLPYGFGYNVGKIRSMSPALRGYG